MPISSKIPAIRFNLKDKNQPNKETLIYLIFRYGKNRLKYSTREKVKPIYWDGQRAKYTKKHTEYSSLNSRLNTLENHTKDIFIEYNYGEISLVDFKKELNIRTGKIERSTTEDFKTPTLVEFIEQFIQYEKKKVDNNRDTWKKFITVQNQLDKYAEEENFELSYETIDWHFRKTFLNWLYEKPRKYSINYASKIFEVIKIFMNESLKLRYHDNKTFLEKGFGVKRVKTKNKTRFNFEEIKELTELDLSDHLKLDRVRDLFIVGCYTGLRFSDWHKVNQDNLLIEDGVELMEILTKKQKQQVYIPCLPELKKVLEKYNYQLPEISSQKFNLYIKDVAKLASIDTKYQRIYSKGGTVTSERIEKHKMISSHCARRSFASNFYNMGIPPFILMQVTGHTTEKQFFEYIDVDAKELALRFAKQVMIRNKKKK